MLKHKKILIAIFLFSLALRLFFAFQTPYYDYDSYFTIRQVESIADTGKPIFEDSLSYQGREHIFSPAYYNGLAFFKTLLPDIVAFKIIPNLFASAFVIIAYFFAERITKDKKISLLTAFTAAFIPVYFSETINTISVYSLTIPLTFLTLYLMLDIEKKNHSYLFAISAFLLSILHPSSIILIIGMFFYAVVMRLENIKQERKETEAILFSIFLVLWIHFLIYKRAFIEYGSQLIWQNIPPEILSQHFAPLSLMAAILSVGFIPLIAGIYLVYKFLFRAKDKNIYLLIAFVLSVSLLLYMKVIEFRLGFMFLGCFLAILFSKMYSYFETYLGRTRFAGLSKTAFSITTILIIATSLIPSIILSTEAIKDSPSQSEINALKWIEDNTPEDSTVIAPLKYGFIIEKIAKRKTIIDSEFLVADKPSQRLKDIEELYTIPYKTDAINLFNKYNADYIFLSEKIKKDLNITQLKYIDNECFIKVYEEEVIIYKSLCELEEI